MTRLLPVYFTQHRYEHQGETQIRYSEQAAPSARSRDFTDGWAVIGFGLRPTGEGVDSTLDADEFRAEAEQLCVKTHWLNPVWREPFDD